MFFIHLLKQKKDIMEIITTVVIKGTYGTRYVKVNITEKDLIEIAEKKALEIYDPSCYSVAEFDQIEEIKLKQ